MILLLNGPASGKMLSLRRAPRYLRVVIDQDGSIDALDQLDDQPKPTEVVYVYVLASDVSRGFACTRGKGCDPILSAEYMFRPQQPEDATLRDRCAWQRWCIAQARSKTTETTASSQGE